MDALIPKEDPPTDCGFSLVQYDTPKRYLFKNHIWQENLFFRVLEESCSEVELCQEEAIINDIFPPKVSRARHCSTDEQISITINQQPSFTFPR